MTDEKAPPPDLHGPSWDLPTGEASPDDVLSALNVGDASSLPEPPPGHHWEHPGFVNGSYWITRLMEKAPPDTSARRFKRSTPEQNALDMDEQVRELRKRWILVLNNDAAGIALWEADYEKVAQYQRQIEADRMARAPVETKDEEDGEPVDRSRGSGTHLRTIIIGDEGEPSSDEEPRRLGPNEISPRSYVATKRRREVAARRRQLLGSSAPIVGSIKRGE